MFWAFCNAGTTSNTFFGNNTVFFFWFPALYSIELADLVTNGAANAVVFFDGCLLSLEFRLPFHNNTILWALYNTGTTANTFFIVNLGKKVLNFDCVVSADLCTKGTADTTYGTNFANLTTLVSRVTLYMNRLGNID